MSCNRVNISNLVHAINPNDVGNRSSSNANTHGTMMSEGPYGGGVFTTNKGKKVENVYSQNRLGLHQQPQSMVVKLDGNGQNSIGEPLLTTTAAHHSKNLIGRSSPLRPSTSDQTTCGIPSINNRGLKMPLKQELHRNSITNG